MSLKREVISAAQIEQSILLIHGLKVMLDFDLAGSTELASRLNEQVRKNLRRFSSDFMIRLNREEFEVLRSHFATLMPVRGEHLAIRLTRNYFSFVLSLSEELIRLCRH
jgi:hypothetical protein